VTPTTGLGDGLAGWLGLALAPGVGPEHADDGGRAKARVHVHRWEPPRHAPGTPLLGVVDLVQGGVDHPVGQLVRAFGEEGTKHPVELTLVGHRSRPPATATGRSSASMAARIARWA
jgi:hypothetical protein